MEFKHLFKYFFNNHNNSKINIKNILTKKFNKRFIFLTGMCRTAYIIVLDYLKEKYPDKNEIIMCSYNLQEMVDITRIKNFNLKLLDTNIENCSMDIENIRRSINNKTVAIVYTNMFNNSKILLDIQKLCNEKKILFIEDNAIYYNNYTIKNDTKIYSGSFGDVSLLSFGIMKNISALFGGACLTSNEELAKYISKKIEGYNEFSKVLYFKQIIKFFILKICLSKIIYNLGFFYIIKLAELKKINFLQKLIYPAFNFKKKKEIPADYTSRISPISISIIESLLNDSSQVKNDYKRKNNNKLYYELLTKENNISTITITDFDFQNFLDFPIIVKNKNKLINYLYLHGLEVRTHFYSNCESLVGQQKNMNSEFIDNNIICLPSHHDIEKKRINEYCFSIKEFYKI